MIRLLRMAGLFLLASALFGGLALLFYKTQAINTDLTQQTGRTLSVFEDIDTKMNLDVLRSYMGIQQNYDELAKALPLLAQNQQTLKTQAGQLSLPELDEQAAGLQALFQEKIQLIEGYKTHHALLRNALYALPNQLAELRDKLAVLQKEAMDESGQQLRYTGHDVVLSNASSLTTELLALVAFSKTDGQAVARQYLTVLNNPAATFAPEIAPMLEPLLRTADVILQRWERVNDRLTAMQASSAQIDAQLDTLNNQLETTLNAQITAQHTWRNVLIGYSAALLLLLAFLGWRLWRSFQALDKANASLEERVKERTQALSDAMTELKESQLQLIQSEKMASLGQMVAGVAHEINTPLAYVKGGLEVVNTRLNDVDSLIDETSSLMQLMNADPDEDGSTEQELGERFNNVQDITSAFAETEAIDELRGLLGDGLHGIGQISEIVANLKDFSRLDRARLDQFNVNDGIDSTLKIAQNIVKHRRIEKIPGDVPMINCSPSQINQVFLNLISNACQATSAEDGKVTIATYATDRGVAIEISDNGQGIAEQDVARIFDPFFTTKAVGEGTGLGLSIVQRIIKEHDGEIKVDSTRGVGTRFTLLLPYNAEALMTEVRAAA